MAMLEVVAHLKANADNMVSGFRRAQGAANSFGGTMTQTAGVARTSFGMISKFAMLGAGAMQTAGLMGAKMGIGFAMANEQAIISFKTLLGSQEAAMTMFKDLQTFAASTPFEFPQLRDAASKLLTTGVAAERIKPMLTAIGDATAAMGTGAEGIAAATRALQQMNLVGKVTGQDMMQLANAGIPAWDALAAAAGKSVAEVKKASETGTLENSVQLLMSGLENYQGQAMSRVKGMMAEQSQTLVGLMSTLKDNINIALGDMMKPATLAIKNALPKINEAVAATFKGMTEPINAMVTRMMAAFTDLIPAIQPTMIALSTIMVATFEAVVPVVAQIASVLPSLQPLFTALGKAIADVGIILGPLIAQLTVALVPILLGATTAVISLTGFFTEHEAVLDTLVATLGGLIAAYAILKAYGKISMLLGSAKSVWGMVAAVLGLTGAQSAEAAAATAATTAQAALAVAQAQAMVAAGGGAAAASALAAAQVAQTAATTAASAATWSLAAALQATGIPLLIAAVVGLVVAFVMLWRKSEWFRNLFKNMWNKIVDTVEGAVNKVLGYWEWWLNKAIDAVNLLIAAWNKIPFNKDIKSLKHVNLELDLSAIKVDTMSAKYRKMEDATSRMLKNIREQKYGVTAFADEVKRLTSHIMNQPKAKETDPDAAARAQAEAEAKMSALVSAAKQLGTSAKQKAEGFFNSIKDRADKLSESVRGAVMQAYSFTEAYAMMADTARTFAEAERAVQEAEMRVSDALAARDIKAYSEAVREYAYASEALGRAEQGKMTFLQALEQQYKKAKDFDVIINRLRAAGLNEAGISQILQAGAETGSKIGEEILAGGTAAVANANTWYDELLATAKSTAKATQDQFYATGLSTGEQLLKGITDAVKNFELKLSSKGLTKGQIEKLKKDFGVDIKFEMSALSKLATPMASGGIVRARSGGTLALLGEAGRDEAVIPLPKNGAYATGGNTYHITVQAGIGDPTSIGHEVVKVLQAYEKRSGRLPIRTQ